MTILDGKKVASERKTILKERVEAFGKRPTLHIVQVGDLDESNLYIKKKKEFGEEIGVLVKVLKFKENTSQKEIISVIKEDEADGILVQLPLPKEMDKKEILSAISERKDVDGLNSNRPSAVVKGISILLEEYNIVVENKRATVIGYSDLVGKPLERWLKDKGAFVNICDENTLDLVPYTTKSDLIFTAVGKPGLIKKEHVVAGQVIVDIGTTVVSGKLYGDVSFDEVKDIAKYITPVPGGVGPLTVVGVFENLLDILES